MFSIKTSIIIVVSGLKINEKIQSHFAARYKNLVAIFANFSCKITALHCVVSRLAKNMSPQYLCVKKPLKMANDQRNGAVHVTLQLNYSTIMLSSEKIHSKKQNNFVIYLFILAKVAAKWQLLTLLFQKSEGDNKSQICDFSRYFSRKGKTLNSGKCDCIGRNFEPWVYLQYLHKYKMALHL